MVQVLATWLPTKLHMPNLIRPLKPVSPLSDIKPSDEVLVINYNYSPLLERLEDMLDTPELGRSMRWQPAP